MPAIRASLTDDAVEEGEVTISLHEGHLSWSVASLRDGKLHMHRFPKEVAERMGLKLDHDQCVYVEYPNS